jgi:hypothetical protein
LQPSIRLPLAAVEHSSLISLALHFAIGGVACSLVLFATEYYGGSRRTSVMALLLAGVLLLAATGMHFAGFSVEWTVPLPLLATLTLAGLLMRVSAVREMASRIAHPLTMWSLVLVASIAAAVFVLGGANPPPDANDLPLPTVTGFHYIPTVVAVTDTGRELPLCAYDETDSLHREELSILQLEQYAHQIIRIAEPATRSNCHGWVYCGGQYAVRSRDVDAILTDNGYEAVTKPAVGDVAIYRTAGNEVAHTGLVRLVREDGSVICESKWGPLGVYLHPVACQPYGAYHTYYRSQRGSHLVTVLPTTSRPADDGAPLASADDSLDPLPMLSATPAKPTRRPIYERPSLRVPGQRRT